MHFKYYMGNIYGVTKPKVRKSLMITFSGPKILYMNIANV